MTANIYDSPNSNLSSSSDEPVALSPKEILFSFGGRITRLTYWLYFLGIVGVMIALMVVLSIFGLSEDAIGGLIIVLYIPFVWVSLALQIKRWHDRDKSGWWVFITVIPLIGPLWAFVENGCLAGTPGSNTYGPPQK